MDPRRYGLLGSRNPRFELIRGVATPTSRLPNVRPYVSSHGRDQLTTYTHVAQEALRRILIAALEPLKGPNPADNSELKVAPIRRSSNM